MDSRYDNLCSSAAQYNAPNNVHRNGKCNNSTPGKCVDWAISAVTVVSSATTARTATAVTKATPANQRRTG